jgi:hypothetical protein
MDLYRTRTANFAVAVEIRRIDHEASESQGIASFAQAYQLTEDLIAAMMGNRHDISNELARELETKLSLPPGWMDCPNGSLVTCHRDTIPDRVKRELARLYGKVLVELKLPDTSPGAYTVWHGNQASMILLFRRNGPLLEVVNQIIEVSHEEIRGFVEFMFAQHRELQVIRFKAINSTIDASRFPFPLQQHNATETFLIDLPSTPEDYERSLGKSTRKTIRWHTNRLTRDFASFRCEVYSGRDVPEQHVREILELRRKRLATKGIADPESEESIDNIVRLSKSCGLVVAMLIDERICAGLISFSHDRNCIAYALGHDERYNDYSIGMLSFYRLICEAIRHGTARCDLGSERYQYKERFLAYRIDMDRLDIYRSHRRMLVHADNVIGAALASYRRKIKLWSHDNASSPFARMRMSTLNQFQHLKRIIQPDR